MAMQALTVRLPAISTSLSKRSRTPISSVVATTFIPSCRLLFPKRHWGTMAESETFAHLEHMVNAGMAERWEEDGVLHYRVAEAS